MRVPTFKLACHMEDLLNGEDDLKSLEWHFHRKSEDDIYDI